MSRREYYRLGVIALAILGALVAGVLVLSTMAVGQRTYTAVLEHTGGLRVGEEVQVAGVGVGEIQQIQLGDDQVNVEFSMSDDIELGDQTRAEVKVATLLGTHFLLVTPHGDEELDQATIAMEHTRVPYNLQDVINDVTPQLQKFDSQALNRAFAQFTEVLNRSGDQVAPALDGVRDLSAAVRARSGDLEGLLKAVRTVSKQLNNNTDDVVGLMQQSNLLLDTLNNRREAIRAMLADLRTLSDNLSGVLDDTKADIGPTLRDLNTTIALLKEQRETLDKSLKILGPTARYVANAAGTGSWLDLYLPGALPDTLGCLTEGRCQ